MEPKRFVEIVKESMKTFFKENGYSKAWQHHKGRNPHHYEYWMDNFDKGGEATEMPWKYKVEMICDYLGAARAYMGKNFSYRGE